MTTVVRLRRKGVKVSLVSNADPRICELLPPEFSWSFAPVKTLESLHILPLLSHPPTLSWDVEISKPDPRIFQTACEACDEQPAEGVIMVGDELEACVYSALKHSLYWWLIQSVQGLSRSPGRRTRSSTRTAAGGMERRRRPGRRGELGRDRCHTQPRRGCGRGHRAQHILIMHRCIPLGRRIYLLQLGLRQAATPCVHSE